MTRERIWRLDEGGDPTPLEVARYDDEAATPNRGSGGWPHGGGVHAPRTRHRGVVCQAARREARLREGISQGMNPHWPARNSGRERLRLLAGLGDWSVSLTRDAALMFVGYRRRRPGNSRCLAAAS